VKNHFLIYQAGNPGKKTEEQMTGQHFLGKMANDRFKYALCRYIFKSEIYVKKW